MADKHIVIVGKTIGHSRQLMETVRKALPQFDLNPGPGGNVYLINWTSDPTKFRGFAKDRLGVLYTEEFDVGESQVLRALSVYPTLHDIVEVAEFLKRNDGSEPKHPGRKFRG